MWTILKGVLIHPYTVWILRIVLGGIFIYASWDKLLNPEQFARAVQNYRILPHPGLNIIAVTLPWVELVCGILLVAGFLTRGAAIIISGLLTVFVLALGSAMIRGIDTSCGCFSSQGTHPITFLFLVRDAVFLVVALHVFFYDRKIAGLASLILRRTIP
ncbi:MAG: DoxX family membrane protein [Deltaproteobacteria bacterium]|nr:DoxX family membrane protein [Deltaproteobacteria bacterium]